MKTPGGRSSRIKNSDSASEIWRGNIDEKTPGGTSSSIKNLDSASEIWRGNIDESVINSHNRNSQQQ